MDKKDVEALAEAISAGFQNLGSRIAYGEGPAGTENLAIPLSEIAGSLSQIAGALSQIAETLDKS